MANKLNWPAFRPADLLLPVGCDMRKWSVVACDQYTSQPDYWQRVADFVGDAPSTLNMILPEFFLREGNTMQRRASINQTMDRYLAEGNFRVCPDALIYVERWLSGGQLRRGLVGAIDLEDYDYDGSQEPLIRATEGTVVARIPPRMAIRRGAALELSHVLLLMDDPEKRIIEQLTYETNDMEMVYDFDLMEQGGHITGYLLTEEQKADICQALNELNDPRRFEELYDAHGEEPMLFAVGDGNHSLATARACYLEQKELHPELDWEHHPARYATVELVNLHDDSLDFEAIHRVVFSVDPEKLLAALVDYYPGTHYGEGEGQTFRYVWEKGEGAITIPDPVAQLAVGSLQGFLDYYLTANDDGYVDYVHGEDVTARLGRQPGNIGFLLPSIHKADLFKGVIHDGALPRKTFSMGEACDKRFYLEAKKIK
ncbi:MAG: DUF1015 domain-containing protein [Clostridiales bacterium]|nr:DUF1015 domain-containing protein [Clostridiales bacterium]